MTAPAEPTPAAPALAPAVPAPAEPTTAPTPVAPADPAPFDPKALSPEVKAYLAEQLAKAKADAENRARVTSKENARKELLAEFAKATGEADPTPEDLGKLLAEQRAENRALRVGQAVRDACAGKYDVDLVAAVLEHGGKVADLDPSASDFAEKVSALVEAEVARKPSLKLALAPTPVSQGAVGGFNGSQAGPRIADLDGAVAKAMGR